VVMVPERGQIRPAQAAEKPALQTPAQSHSNEWVHVGTLEDIPANAGVAARLGQQQIALFHLPGAEPQIFALENHEPGSGANVLARGLLGDVAGEPVVISPLYKKRFRLCDGVSPDDAALRVRVWPVQIKEGQIWVHPQPLSLPEYPAMARAS